MIYHDVVIYSTGGHDAMWFQFEKNGYELQHLFDVAYKRWKALGYAEPKALYVLRKYDPTCVRPGDSFCGFDNRTDSNTLKYYKEYGLTHVST